jgi:multidrug efflux system membrane fusion protein
MIVFTPHRAPHDRSLAGAAMGRILLLLACLLFLLAGCSSNGKDDGKSGQRKKAGVPVTVEVSQKKTLPLEITATGHVEASATVEVRSQVTGTLKTVHFKEGDDVKAGELLFSIDPRPFAANLAKAEAALVRDKAELENARRAGGRYALAAEKGFVSAEQADQAATKIATLAATVQADQAAIDAARLELEYCSIRSPFAGRAGEIATDQGNLIKANADSPMVTINQTRPILATFTVPGKHLQEIVRYRNAGSLKVLAANRAADQEPITGSLAFIDNTVDPTTGVIRLKASFANAGSMLWPGELIDVRLQLALRPDCVVVPSQAIQTGQKGPYVYVVKDDQTVAYRPVTPGMLHQGETVIESGLQAEERVVTDGQMQLADGVKVEERPKTPMGKNGGSGKEAESGANSGRGSR